jgi:hypothetical protein
MGEILGGNDEKVAKKEEIFLELWVFTLYLCNREAR